VVAIGVDVGSLTAKAVVVDADTQEVLASAMIDTGWTPKESGEAVFERALADAGGERTDVGRIIGTGYGRVSLPFVDDTVTEITCHARGTHHLMPEARGVIDIGGQDVKVMRLDESGRVVDFAMNDRCAAGTGRFFEVMAHALGVPLSDFVAMANAAQRAATISSMCTVFAESEVIGLVANGVPKDEIVAGIHKAVASRVAALAERVRLDGRVAFVGGVALNEAMRNALAKALGREIEVPDQPQLVGALGAALIAAERLGA
jgi:predicted CoA-substrate-specific enzyme activase